jgi:hypothetical protein
MTKDERRRTKDDGNAVRTAIIAGGVFASAMMTMRDSAEQIP